MIKIQPIVRGIVMEEIEAYFALLNGYMNMSSYSHRIRPAVEKQAKKKVTITSLVVSLSRIRKELQKEKPLIPSVNITNITTKLPLSEIVYENTAGTIEKLQTLYKKVPVTREDFFTATIGTYEVDIICSSMMASKIIEHFSIKPKQFNKNLAAVGISLDPECCGTANTFLALFSAIARARINIEEIVSTSTEFIFIVAEKDFTQTVAVFSKMHQSNFA